MQKSKKEQQLAGDYLIDERKVWGEIVLRTQIDFNQYKFPLKSYALICIKDDDICFFLNEKKDHRRLYMCKISDIDRLSFGIGFLKYTISFYVGERHVHCVFKRISQWKKVKKTLEGEL